jgi:hypothetical protein
MRRRDLVKLLLSAAAAPMLLPLGASGALAQDAPPDAPDAPAGPSDRNNIVGLNVARLHQPLYIWAASDLVNANGGDWGYITVVWTIQDREDRNAEYNLQLFLDRCYEFHVQPIVRVATKFEAKREPVEPGQRPIKPNEQGAEGSWIRPDGDEPAKWRAFFETGKWPTRHAWIIVGNEPNLGREWGGAVDAASYARYLGHFLDVFKDAPRFDVVGGALDISNTTAMPTMQDALEFLDGMRDAVPGIFERLPAWASNPYRVLNRGASARYTHRAYEIELDHIGREMPVLITEAGHLDTGDEQEIARFYEDAFRDWRADAKVVAATPLFWHPDRNDFWMFELDKKGAFVHKSPTYELMRRIPRVAGSAQYTVTLANTARTTRFEEEVAEELPSEDGGGPRDSQPPVSERLGDNWELDGKTAASAGQPTVNRPEQALAEGGAGASTVPLRNDGRPAGPAFAPPGRTAAEANARPPTSTNATSRPTSSADANARATPPAALPMRVANTGGAGARLRTAPSRQAESIAVLPDGALVQAFGPEQTADDATWQRVRADDGAEGWVASDLLTPAAFGGR